MANNRIILVCNVCNEGISIARYYPSTGWYFHNEETPRDDWMEQHWKSCNHAYKDTAWGTDAFRFIFESDDFEEWHYPK